MSCAGVLHSLIILEARVRWKHRNDFVFDATSSNILVTLQTVATDVGENNGCIPPNPRRVGYIVPIHGPLYMGSHIHQHSPAV